eukprot:GHVO01049073.1.p1 GENE.GHVO01049073.1~~GHVO01049073.1.p1  ORF type:complete len:232 (+),score=37.68 GHVO01049073.1:203-898(+)
MNGIQTMRQKELQKDLQYFSASLESIRQYAPTAKVFCLIHKTDLVNVSHRQEVLNFYTQELRKRCNGAQGNATDAVPIECAIFGTSIWDETLFKAWSEIVYSLVPNVSEWEQLLGHFASVCEADEVVLFEKSTFLVISHAARKEHQDGHRLEKISNMCKQLKLTCSKTQSNFLSLTVQNPTFTAYIERFTQNTYIMIIVSERDIEAAATFCNIDYAREHFERIAEQIPLGF